VLSFLSYLCYSMPRCYRHFSKCHVHNPWSWHGSIPSSVPGESLAMVLSCVHRHLIRSSHSDGWKWIRHVLDLRHPERFNVHHMYSLSRQIRILGPITILSLARRRQFHQYSAERRVPDVLFIPTRQPTYPARCLPEGIQNVDGKSVLQDRSRDPGESGDFLGLYRLLSIQCCDRIYPRQKLSEQLAHANNLSKLLGWNQSRLCRSQISWYV